MVVVIANKLKDYIESSDLKALNYKCATGYYSAKVFVENLKTLDIEMLIIDLTAIEDANDVNSWKLFSNMVVSENIFILQDSNSSNYTILSTLVSCGLYNFGKSVSEILKLIETPNTFENVSRYVNRGPVRIPEKEVNKELNIYEEKVSKHQDLMKDYLRRYNEGEFDTPTKINVLKDQVLVGTVYLPLLTLICTAIFYLLLNIIYSKFTLDTYLGQAIYGNVPTLNANLLATLGLFISSIVFLIYYCVLDQKIKKLGSARGKFMILSFSLYCLIMFGDYYLFGIIEGILSKVPQITPNSYLYQDLVSFNFYVVLCAVVVYYVKLVIHKNKTLVFEKDLSQSFTWVEKLYTLVLYGSVGLPIVYIIAGLVHSDTQFYELVANLYVESGVMTGLTVVGIILTIINLVSRLINPNRNFDFKEMEI